LPVDPVDPAGALTRVGAADRTLRRLAARPFCAGWWVSPEGGMVVENSGYAQEISSEDRTMRGRSQRLGRNRPGSVPLFAVLWEDGP
jgi:hypothetical protein